MGILESTGQDRSITEGWRALELFTDRRVSIRLFASYLHGPPRRQILFFHGDGGNGKSLLLRYLQERACKRLSEENWEWVSRLDDDDFVSQLESAEGTKVVPSAFLDLGAQPRGEDRPQEAFSALLMLRRQLAPQGFAFPSFDYACLRYLHKTGGLTNQRLELLFPSDEFSPIRELAEIVSGAAWPVQAALTFFNKSFGARFKLFQARRQLGEDELAEIERMDVLRGLVDELPHLFSKDVNAQMGDGSDHSRLVLLFDTHESFWRDAPAMSKDLFFERNEWLRRLLGTLDLASGIVGVVAGRERPRWTEAPKVKIPEEFLDVHLVGHLPRPYAVTYLESAGIEDPAMREVLVRFAETEPGEVHPLYLGLCSDIVIAAKSRGTPVSPETFQEIPALRDKASVLVDRLLRYVDREVEYAVQALTACRAFDRDVYRHLGEAMNFDATDPSFRLLTQLSFVWRAERRGEGWYRIHDLLRRLAREREDELLVLADEALEGYYSRRGEDGDMPARAEAIYHLNQTNPERGVEEWVKSMDEAVERSRLELFLALLDVRTELKIPRPDQAARISRAAARFFGMLAKYEEGIQEFSNAVRLYEEMLQNEGGSQAILGLGAALRGMGELQTHKGAREDATTTFPKAIEVLEQTIAAQPDLLEAYSNLAQALWRLGEIVPETLEEEGSIALFRRAIDVSDEALRRDPEYLPARLTRASALMKWGGAVASLARHDEAISILEQAVLEFDEILERNPTSLPAHSYKGMGLGRIADMHEQRSRLEEALKANQRAVVATDQAVKVAPDFPLTHNNKGFTLQLRAGLLKELKRHEEALATYDESIAELDEALRIAPDLTYSHHSKGFALTNRGDLLAKMDRPKEALDTFERAILAFDGAVQRVPDSTDAHNGRGHALRGRGEELAKLGREAEALESFEDALREHGEAIRLAPAYAHAYHSEARAYRERAELLVKIGRPEEADASYARALDSLSRALEIAKDYVWALSTRALVYEERAKLLQSRGEAAEKVVELMKSGLADVQSSLELAPNDVEVIEIRDRLEAALKSLKG